MGATPETKLVMVDGCDALAAVVILPNAETGGYVIEANANGMSKQQAAHVLRHVADLWDPPKGSE